MNTNAIIWCFRGLRNYRHAPTKIHVKDLFRASISRVYVRGPFKNSYANGWENDCKINESII